MNRIVWLLMSLIIGFGGAFLFNENSDGLTYMLAAALGIPGTAASAFGSIDIALTMATGGIMATALGILLLALLDGYATHNAVSNLGARLAESPKTRKKISRGELLEILAGSGPLERAAETYELSLTLASTAATPPANAGIIGSRASAANVFTTMILVDRALYLWFFRGLAFATAGAGFALALIIVASGNPSFAALALAADTVCAVTILVLAGFVSTLRRHQVERLQACLEGLFPSDPWGGQISAISATTAEGLQETAETIRKARSEIVKAINSAARSTGSSVEGSLEKWRADLTDTIEKSLKAPMAALAGDQSKSVRKLVDNTLKSIRTGLQEPMKKQVTDLEKSVKSASHIIAQTQKAFDKANADLAKNLTQHEKALSKDFAGYAESLKVATDGQTKAAGTLDQLSASIAASLDGMKPLLDRIAAGQENLMSTIEDEATAAQVIGASSKDLNAAAKASRESIEQFVSLAENLKAVSVALQNAGTASVSKADGDRPAELSQAIRDLKESSGKRSLPKL